MSEEDLWERTLSNLAGQMFGGEICEWTEGATEGVWKSTCSLVPFLGYRPRTKECPYCDRPVKVTSNKPQGDQDGK